ncbi:hypothetical protein HPB52_022182 [Rhipicephalus sanguineus]|uniref:GT23 domain-containing protein n=1 Tax=Rhipicephalus sanguineus TaxID=34632 RepID=A0A9D4PSR5_RHISA|nr:hypothetical protein HPB52_022182 [Rhipicephalus sanguineus]
MCEGNDAPDARAVTAALTHIVKEKALPSKDMGIRDENIEEAAVSIPEDVIEELEALREPPRKPPNSVAYSGLVYVGGYIAKLITDVGTKSRRRILDLPVSIAATLVANHADPYAWWYGQIMGYIFRLQDSFRRKIETFKREIGYKHPIVSIHVRRTDKKQEAAYHGVEEYMGQAEEFYSALALRGEAVEKRVFVATDEPDVIDEIKLK